MRRLNDREAYIRGLDTLSWLYGEHPSLPAGGDAQTIDLHQYGSKALPVSEQIDLAVAVIEQMTDPEIHLHLNRGAPTAWLYVHGYLEGALRVSVKMWADDVCERRPEEKRKRDRWVVPTEIVAAVQAGTEVAESAA